MLEILGWVVALFAFCVQLATYRSKRRHDSLAELRVEQELRRDEIRTVAKLELGERMIHLGERMEQLDFLITGVSDSQVRLREEMHKRFDDLDKRVNDGFRDANTRLDEFIVRELRRVK